MEIYKVWPITSYHIICLLLMNFIWSSNNKTLRENVTFRPLFDSQDENKHCKTSLKLHKAYQIIFYSIICLLLKCRWSSSDKLYMTENVIVWPSYDPRGPQRAKKSYCTSSWHPNYILEDILLDILLLKMLFKWHTLQKKGNNVYQPWFDD